MKKKKSSCRPVVTLELQPPRWLEDLRDFGLGILVLIAIPTATFFIGRYTVRLPDYIYVNRDTNANPLRLNSSAADAVRAFRIVSRDEHTAWVIDTSELRRNK